MGFRPSARSLGFEARCRSGKMNRYKRSQFLSFDIGTVEELDLEAFLRGRVSMRQGSRLTAFSAISGERFPVSMEDVQGLLQVPSDQWTALAEVAERSGLAESRLEELAHLGALVSTREGEIETKLRDREDRLTRQQWSPEAARYHFATRLEEKRQPEGPRDIAHLSANSEEKAREVVALRGAPPPAFHRREGEFVPLPEVEPRPGRPFFEVLESRRTVRGFDDSISLPLEQLSMLVRWVFGARGIARLTEGVELLHKTSPSGGSLHPIEAYPLVLRVEGLETGLYHIETRSRGLRRILRLDLDAAQALAIESSRGQLYAGQAACLFVLTARWGRNFWKYRRSSRTYRVVLKDLGHLSQTFYLTAAELGLGAFYTGAIWPLPLEELLGLDSEDEAILGICGCGLADEGNELGLPFEPIDQGAGK